MSEVIATDAPEGERTWEVCWHCEPPTFTDWYRVTHDSWSDNYGVRHIYAYSLEASPAATGDTTPTNTP